MTEAMKIAERRAAVIEEPPTPEISEEESLDESSEEEEEDELPEMTEEMLNEVNNALKGQPTNEVLTEGFRLRLTRKDMATLQGLNWLNDEVRVLWSSGLEHQIQVVVFKSLECGFGSHGRNTCVPEQDTLL